MDKQLPSELFNSLRHNQFDGANSQNVLPDAKGRNDQDDARRVQTE